MLFSEIKYEVIMIISIDVKSRNFDWSELLRGGRGGGGGGGGGGGRVRGRANQTISLIFS